ncbi:glycosyltransferase [Bacteroides caecigallinarum]|nr:glycosyltransferase [Bacteroides caecigallinarum]
MVKFSIIIPAYNSEWCIKRCLESILNQTYSNWEAIVIDNNSTDRTIEIVKEFKDNRIKFFSINNNGIIAKSRNYGISKSEGEFICFLDSDDYWQNNKLEVCCNFTDNYDFIYHKMRINLNNKEYKYIDNCCNDFSIYNFFTKENRIVNSSVIIRKNIVSIIGLLCEDERIITVEDLDYWIRVTNVTKKIKYINDSLGYYWIGNSNSSFNIKCIKANIYLYGKYAYLLSRAQKRKAKDFVRYKIARIYHYNKYYSKALEYYIQIIKNISLRNYLFKSLVLSFLCIFQIRK